MARRRQKGPTTRSDPASPGPGSRIVVDTQLLADYLLAEYEGSPSPGACSVDRLLRACCVLCDSAKLTKEIAGAVHGRGLRVPHAPIEKRWLGLDKTGKRLRIPTSRLQTARIARDAVGYIPREDLHVVRLAVAARASHVVTRDQGLLAGSRSGPIAAKAASEPVVVDPEWVIEVVPEGVMCTT